MGEASADEQVTSRPPAGSARSTRRLNRRLKSWPAWVLMGVLALGFVVVGATRASGPQTPEDRVDDITKRLACPVCDGESVFESQNNASRSIRNQVADFVFQNELSDEEIIEVMSGRDEAGILLVPEATGGEALVWVVRAVAFVIAVVGLGFAFRRWRDEAAAVLDPTDADRELVADALLADEVDRESRDDAAGTTT